MRRYSSRGSRLLIVGLTLLCASGAPARAPAQEPVMLAGHLARFDAQGHLLPWTSWRDALQREMRFYQGAPKDHGYPRFVTQTFLEADWSPDPGRHDTIPAMQDGMGIISYLQYYQWRGRREPQYLATARAMGDYLLHEALTPPNGAYPRFVRSTGTRGQFPEAANSGTQADHPFEIEPDKGGIAGYALLKLFQATGERDYLHQALHLARVLVVNQIAGDRSHSPWPFRVDYRTGVGRGAISGNMSYILRLLDGLQRQGYQEFAQPRRALWRWIKEYQIPSATADGALFAQFFEDHDNPGNRTAWAPLSLAHYLLDRRSALDPDWRRDVGTLMDFVRRNFIRREFGVTVCFEQDEDHDAWGGINSTYGAVLALYAKATGSAALAAEARQVLNFTLYAIDERGRPRDLVTHSSAGGWQEDAHTDVIHNFIDAMQAYPDWAD